MKSCQPRSVTIDGVQHGASCISLSVIFRILLLCTILLLHLASSFTTAPSTSSQYCAIFSDKASSRRKATQLAASPWIRPDVTNLLGPISPATLQKYNLTPDTITNNGWSAQLVTLTAKSLEEGTEIQLVPKNSNEHFVDTCKIEVPLPLNDPDSSIGLGIELLEIEGGREDGLGITIVNGLVAGGNAERANSINSEVGDGETIMVGDSITSADLVLQSKGKTDVTSIRTECLDYESTVDSLVGMLSTLNNNGSDRQSIQEASVILTLKRLRRRPNLQVKVMYPPSQDLEPVIIQLQPGENLRLAMLQRGIKLNDELAQRYDGKATGSGNCGGGAMCRTCAVSVSRGGELLSRPKQNEKKIIEEMNPRYRLSCKSWVGYGMEEGEIVIQVDPRQW